jgi:hypothetical protein
MIKVYALGWSRYAKLCVVVTRIFCFLLCLAFNYEKVGKVRECKYTIERITIPYIPHLFISHRHGTLNKSLMQPPAQRMRVTNHG